MNARASTDPTSRPSRFPRPRWLCAVAAWSALGFAAVVSAGDRPSRTTGGGAPGETKWSLDLLPRSLQARPELEIWVYTEHTARGEKLVPPTPERPVGYVTQEGKFFELGEPVRTRSPKAGTLDRVMRTALRAQGYEPADGGRPVSLVLVYNWGTHHRRMIRGEFVPLNTDELLREEIDRSRRYIFRGDGDDYDSNTGLPRARVPNSIAEYYSNSDALSTISMPRGTWRPDRPAPFTKTELTERAALLIGDSFARLFRQQVEGLPEGESVSGESFGRLIGLAQRHPRGDFLLRTINQSLYFVVVTAYDLAGVARGVHEPLWRTKIVVTADGVSLLETAPAMLASAAPYFGREGDAGNLIRRRLDRRGRVVVGDAEVVGWESTPPARVAGGEGAK